MNRLALSILVLGTLAAAAWPANAGRYPLRQIDRPLILPKKMWQERLSQNAYLEKETEWFSATTNAPEGFIPNLPAYSLTDNLLWVAVPAPLFRYLITQNNITAENGPAVKDLSVTLDGGLIAFTYSPTGTSLLSTWGASLKQPLLNWLWMEGSFSSVFDYSEFQGLGSSASLGFQLTDRTFLNTAGSLNYIPDGALGSSKDSEGVVPGLSVGAGFNFSPHISLGVHGAMAFTENRTILNPGAELSFQW